MAKQRTSMQVDPETFAKFTAINRALGVSNNKVYEKLMADYVQEHYDAYKAFAKVQAEADKLKAKLSGGK